MPYYAVAKGVKPGIYTSWNVCKQNVSGYKGAIFKKFVSVKQAQEFIDRNSSSSHASLASQASHSDTASNLANSKDGARWRVTGARSSVQSTKLEYHKLVPYLKVSLEGEYHGQTRKFKSQSSKIIGSDVKVQRIYVDGASRGNGKIRLPISGYGVFYGADDERNSAISLSQVDDVHLNKPTNQRAELFAIKHALVDIANELTEAEEKITTKYAIYSDSQYAQSCITKWCDDWMQNSWKTSQGKPVSNKDIIASVIPILNYINRYYNNECFGDLEFFHVRGHRGDYGNEMADKLANIGADDMERELRTE